MTPHCELRAASAFSFLRGAASPEALAARAAEQGYAALALVDRDGLYGVPRLFRAAKPLGLRPIVGAELALLGEGRLLLLARDAQGYRHLCRLSTLAHARGELAVSWEELEAHAGGLTALTGDAEGALTLALARDPAPLLGRLVACFGQPHVIVEVQRHGDPREERRNRQALELAVRHGLRAVATQGARFAVASQRPLYDVLTCLRERVTLDLAGELLSRNADRHLLAPAQLAARFADQPALLTTAREVAGECAFTLDSLPYRFPDFPTPAGESQIALLRGLVAEGARRLYRPFSERAQAQLERELGLIEKLGLAGYFLIVADLVRFCDERGILAKGRGSAANSAVCYALNITTVDPLRHDLLFERFLSEEREEWPDIDLDLPSGAERERVIQYVFERYGRRGAAMCAEVITYRDRSAAREVGKVLGFSEEQIARLSRTPRDDFLATSDGRVRLWAELCGQIQDLPRHLSQHSGGMILAGGPLDELVPIEPARMAGRTVIQWDKDDAEALGLIKIDLLGLGMLAALEEARRLVGPSFDVAHLPPDDPAVYALCAQEPPDTIGVFQIESRAQMATLPRLKPRCFYDLVVEVGLIRPGPLVGKLVHPYLRRRAGREAVTYVHPSLRPILERTLGFPIFQEQLLRVAMTLAGFSGGEAEALRRAMTHKRSRERMAAFERRFLEGAEQRGSSPEGAREAWSWFSGFAEYGFPESHAFAFAYWVYASAYLKAHHPAAFLVSLLNAQPMGFYSPATLVKDAQRHGVVVYPPEVAESDWRTLLLPDGSVRLGLGRVRGLPARMGQRLVAERARAPFRSLGDLVRRSGCGLPQLERLALAGALEGLVPGRRRALWELRALVLSGGLAGPEGGESPLAEPDPFEQTLADYRTQGLTTGPQLLTHFRPWLDRLGATRAKDLLALPTGRWTRLAGLVITRQRPATARGLLFVTVEDETGQANAIVRPELFERQRTVLLESALLILEGPLRNQAGVATVDARRLTPFGKPQAVPRSHDFR